MERKLILFFIFSFAVFVLKANDLNYVVNAKSDIFIISDLGNKKIATVKKNTICKIVDYQTKREIVNGFSRLLVKIKSDKIEGWIFSDNLKLNSSDLLNDNVIGNWTLSYYQKAIQNNDESIILKMEYSKDDFYNEKAFWSFFNPKVFIITNSTISYPAPMAEPVCFIEKIIKINNNQFKIIGIDGLSGEKLELVINHKDNNLSIKNWNGFNWDNLVKVNKNDLIENLSRLRNQALEKFKLFYTPTIDSLRFRESPDLDGKFIRSLKKGEKLELLEKGKTETINGTKGTWVKVKTEKGEIGWCFDAYLNEKKK